MSEQLSDARVRRGRVIFDTFRSARDPRLAAWLMFRSHLLPDEAPAPRASTSTSAPTSATVPVGVFGVWRLLASNNRELARCATVFASPAVAVETAIAEQSRAGELHVSPVRGPAATKHAWVLRHEGRPVATAARWYESSGEAAAAGRAAVTVLSAAEVVRGVSIGTESGRRSRVPVLTA